MKSNDYYWGCVQQSSPLLRKCAKQCLSISRLHLLYASTNYANIFPAIFSANLFLFIFLYQPFSSLSNYNSNNNLPYFSFYVTV